MIHNMVFGGGGDLSGTSFVINLAASNWSNNAQTVTVTGLTEDCLVFVGPESEFVTAYSAAGIYCVSHAANSLVFTCTTVPSVDMEVHVLAVSKVEFYDLMKVATPVVADLVKTWDGTAQGPTITRDTNNTVATNTTQIEPGTYSMTIALNDPVNMSWDDGALDDKTYSYTINKIPVDTPSVSVGTYTYNGSAQGPTVTRDTDHTTITDATNVEPGTYTLTIALGDSSHFIWTDNTSADKSYSYTINKASSNMSVSPTSMTFNTETAQTISVTKSGDGAISVSNTNTGVATTSVSGNTITVTPVSNGSATLTVTVAATDHYTGDSKTVAITVAVAGVEYYGTATGLSVARYYLAATTVGNYGLFGGGCSTSAYTYPSTVDAYNTSLTKTTATDLSLARRDLAATTVGNYGLFGGGYTNSSTGHNNVDAYNASLTKITVTTLSFSTYEASATTVGNYALLGGGRVKSTVNAYDTSLTRTVTESLSAARYGTGATTVGSYALFGGGLAMGTYYATVDVYNTSLTKTTATDLSVGRVYSQATTVGNYGLFGGGRTDKANLSVVDAYNTSLTKTTATDLSVARCRLAATTVGNYGLFGGGTPSAVVMDAYDTSLTRTTETDLSVERYYLAATTVGNYGLFGGGRHTLEDNYTTEPCDTVDVYLYTAS